MKNILSIVGGLCIIIPVSFLWLWIRASNLTNEQHDAVVLYQSYLPGLLKGRYTTSVVGLVFSALAISANAFRFSDKRKAARTFSVVIIILGSILAFINLWSMM